MTESQTKFATKVFVSFTDIGADIAQILSCLALIKIMKQFTQGHE
jgi:hypothetical protein